MTTPTPKRPIPPGPRPVPHPNDKVVQESVASFAKQLVHVSEVNDATAYLSLALSLVQLKRGAKYIEGRKAQITAPVKAINSVIKEWFGETEAELANAESRLKALLEVYVDRRIPEAAAQAQTALAAGDTKGMVSAMGAVPAVPGVTLATVVDFEVTDFDALPEEFKKVEVNVSKVKTEGRAGRTIPGVRFFERTQISVSVPKELM